MQSKPNGDDGSAGGKPTERMSSKIEWQSAVYGWRDSGTGNFSLKADGYVLQKAGDSRQFEFVSLWRFEPEENRWQKLSFRFDDRVSLKPIERTIFSVVSDDVIVNLPQEIGLYWINWREDSKPVGELFCSGPILCNDVDMSPPPDGFIAACVPYPNHALATFVPDPEIHCRE
jgi:hypothetical protein